MSDIIRTPRDGCFELRSNSWGAFLHPIADPESNATLEANALKSFELHPDITPIPAALWSRWVLLCFHFVGKVKSTSEVSCRLLRHEDDKSKWRILVPQQSVDGAAVRVDSFDQAIDIATGEVVTDYPPQGWVACGSAHSHNTMASFWSGTDDKYELGDPGLHIVVGDINVATNRYTLKASITANKRRFEVPFAAVIDTTPGTDTFHPSVLDAISLGISFGTDWSKYVYNQNAAAASKRPAKNNKGKLALKPSPNAGNGYADFDDEDLLGRPLFSSLQADTHISLFDITEQITHLANECISDGDEQGIDHLLHTVRGLLNEIEMICSPSFQTAINNDEHSTDNSSNTGNPTVARALRPSQW